MAIIAQEIVRIVLPTTGFLLLGIGAMVTVLGTTATGFASLFKVIFNVVLFQQSLPFPSISYGCLTPWVGMLHDNQKIANKRPSILLVT